LISKITKGEIILNWLLEDKMKPKYKYILLIIGIIILLSIVIIRKINTPFVDYERSTTEGKYYAYLHRDDHKPKKIVIPADGETKILLNNYEEFFQISFPDHYLYQWNCELEDIDILDYMGSETFDTPLPKKFEKKDGESYSRRLFKFRNRHLDRLQQTALHFYRTNNTGQEVTIRVKVVVKIGESEE